MKLIWLKWGAFASIAVLTNAVAGTTALAQDQPSSQSSSSSAASIPAPAQEKEKKEPIIEQRKENQQNRISDGVKSGQLTARETGNLEKKEAAINKETDADRAANGGKLTPAEKAQGMRQQNEGSKQNYSDKHKAKTAQFWNKKNGQHPRKQQERI